MALAIRTGAGGQAVFGFVWRDWWVFGENLQHTARGIAVQLRDRPAQQFDALGRCQARRCRLALAVRHGGWNAVNQQAHAAHAESRARAEAAYRQLQILRKVLPVAYLQAGHGAHQLRQIDQRGGGAKGVNLYRIDGARRIEASLLGSAAGDDDLLQLFGGPGLRMGRADAQGAGKQHGTGLADSIQ